jgi:hypothetical protein
MRQSEREDVHDDQTGELYKSIGKCSVKFEHVTLAMQAAITLLLQKGGLRNQRLANVLLADLTAYPLTSIFQAMISESNQLSAEEKIISNKIFTRTKKLIERRNDIIHSNWFVGWAGPDDTDFSEASGMRSTRGKRGVIFKGSKHTTAEFDAFAMECDEVARLLNRLCACVTNDLQISKNLLIDEDGKVQIPIQS